MFRRVVSLGQQAQERQPSSDDKMSPSPGDDTQQSPQDSRPSGGLASVFKGLAGAAKLTKSPPMPLPIGPSLAAVVSNEDNNINAAAHGLSPTHKEALEQLKKGSISERKAAAQQLRYAVLDYPLNSV
jgi:hypothetical protein